MNPIVFVHLASAAVAMLTSVPLIRGRIRSNPWLGARIPAAFASEARWLEINRYAGRLLLAWGVVLAMAATVGASLPRPYWLAYDWTAFALVVGGLVLVIAKINRFARGTTE